MVAAGVWIFVAGFETEERFAEVLECACEGTVEICDRVVCVVLRRKW
jgi:hypothetical protein